MVKNAVFGGSFLHYFKAGNELARFIEAVAKNIGTRFKCFISFFVGIEALNCLDALTRNDIFVKKGQLAKGFTFLIQNELSTTMKRPKRQREDDKYFH